MSETNAKKMEAEIGLGVACRIGRTVGGIGLTDTTMGTCSFSLLSSKTHVSQTLDMRTTYWPLYGCERFSFLTHKTVKITRHKQAASSVKLLPTWPVFGDFWRRQGLAGMNKDVNTAA
jgi:hypothetical protein